MTSEQIPIDPSLDHLLNQHFAGKVVRKEKREKLQGKALYNHVVGKILSRCDSTTVQLLKNIGDLTEGQRYNHEINQLNIDENDEAVKAILEKYGILKP